MNDGVLVEPRSRPLVSVSRVMTRATRSRWSAQPGPESPNLPPAPARLHRLAAASPGRQHGPRRTAIAWMPPCPPSSRSHSLGTKTKPQVRAALAVPSDRHSRRHGRFGHEAVAVVVRVAIALDETQASCARQPRLAQPGESSSDARPDQGLARSAIRADTVAERSRRIRRTDGSRVRLVSNDGAIPQQDWNAGVHVDSFDRLVS